jgi:RNA polymerase sigma factor (TIGR02999 family)
MSEITAIIDAIERGDDSAAEKLLPTAYSELRRIAASKMAGEASGHTLQPTALVHEAYLRMAGPDGRQRSWKSRAHFFSAAAEAMRRVLIEHARRKQSLKRGGGRVRTPLDEAGLVMEAPSEELLAVNEALRALESEDPDLARVVILRYFGGLTVPQIADVLGVSERTVNRQWACARAWLYREISES